MTDTMETYRTLTPYLIVPDADAEITFLKAAFGATEKSVNRGPSSEVMHAELQVGDSLLLEQSNAQWKPLGAACRPQIADVELETGNWKLDDGSWQLEAGYWQLAGQRIRGTSRSTAARVRDCRNDPGRGIAKRRADASSQQSNG